MKKGIVLTIVLALVCLLVLPGAAQQTTVYVTIVDQTGTPVLARQAVAISDFDEDGALTVADALYAAHEQFYTGGAAAGYAVQNDATYGLSLKKLWGNDNGSFGYYCNHASCWNLSDTVQDGDTVCAFSYVDLTNYSDLYTFFDQAEITSAAGETAELTLMAAGFDADWNSITFPVAGAEITVDGVRTGRVTDENGHVTLTFTEGAHMVSAVSDTQVLVPPVCLAQATAAQTDTGATAALTVAGLITAASVAVLYKTRREK